MKKVFSPILIFAALFVWVLIRPTFAAEPVATWKVFSPFFVGTRENKTVGAWTDDISNMSGGRMKIDLYAAVPGETLPDLHPHVQNGEVSFR